MIPALRAAAPTVARSLQRRAASHAPAVAGGAHHDALAEMPHVHVPAGYIPMMHQHPIKESDIPFVKTEWLESQEALAAHAPEAAELWRKITFYVAIPAIFLTGLFVYKREIEHAAHIDHEIAENGGEPPERTVYEYMLMRKKPFPWPGNQSLFHNDRANIRASEEFGA